MGRVVVLSLVLLAASVGCRPDDERSRSGPTPVTTTINGRAGTVAGAAASGYRQPVTAPVLDGFRPPPGPFGAGNRGIEYETDPGTAVGAIGDGRVVFAGSVAGTRHVTVHHRDGLRSSYSYLATIEVSVGDPVGPGQSVGTSTARLHLGVRAGDAYLDPALLFDHGGVRLVPIR